MANELNLILSSCVYNKTGCQSHYTPPVLACVIDHTLGVYSRMISAVNLQHSMFGMIQALINKQLPQKLSHYQVVKEP